MEPKKLSHTNMPEATACPKPVVVYICPNKLCTNYYAAPEFMGEGIEKPQEARNQNNGERYDTHPRIECPTCRDERKLHVNRVPYVVTQVVPLEGALEAMRQDAKTQSQ